MLEANVKPYDVELKIEFRTPCCQKHITESLFNADVEKKEFEYKCPHCSAKLLVKIPTWS